MLVVEDGGFLTASFPAISISLEAESREVETLYCRLPAQLAISGGRGPYDVNDAVEVGSSGYFDSLPFRHRIVICFCATHPPSFASTVWG